MKGKKIIWTIMAMAFLTAFTEDVSAQTVVVSGTTLTSYTQSNLVIDYDSSSYDETLEPGDKGILTLVIENTGTRDANEVEVYLPDVPNIKVGKRFFIGTVKYGAPATVSVPYVISKDAAVGFHSIPVQLTFDGYNADGNTISNVKSNFDFPIKVYGKPKLSIEGLSIENAVVGETVNARVTLKNMKTTAYNTVASITSPTPLVTILGSDKQYVGEIGSGESAELSYMIYLSDELESGAYSIPLGATFEDRGHTQYSESFNLGLFVSGEPDVTVTEVTTDPEEVNPDEEDIEVKAKIENVGTSEVDNLKVTLIPDLPFLQSKSYVQTKNLGLFKAGDASTVTFYVDTQDEALEGVYSLDFMLEYQVKKQKVNKTVSLDVVVKDKPEFRVESEPVKASAGQKKSLSVNVVNTGADCSSVTLWVLKKSDHPFEFDDKSQYIGDLDKGEHGESVISFTVEETAQKREYILPLEVRCTRDERVHVVSDSARIVVDGATDDSGPAAMAVPIIAVVFLAYAGYRILSRKPEGKD